MDQYNTPEHLQKLCKHWKFMDDFFKTEKNSPLHHDNRCEFCGGEFIH